MLSSRWLAMDLEVLFSLAVSQFQQKLYFTNCVWKSTLNSVENFNLHYAYNWSPGTLNLSVLWKYCFFSRVISFPDTSTIAHHNPNLQRLCLCLNSLNRKRATVKLKSSSFLLTEIMHAFRLYPHIHTGVHAVPLTWTGFMKPRLHWHTH